MKNNIKVISASLFEIIHKYATGQNCTGDNADLVMSAFKVNLYIYYLIMNFFFN